MPLYRFFSKKNRVKNRKWGNKRKKLRLLVMDVLGRIQNEKLNRNCYRFTFNDDGM